MLNKAQTKERNRKIVDMLRRTKPEGGFYWTLEDVGDRFGITRERVRQIGSKAGLPSRTQVWRQEQQRIRNNAPDCLILHCNNPVKIVTVHGSSRIGYSATGRCVDHGRDVVLITCAFCGKVTERESYVVKQGDRPNKVRRKPQEQWFCNKICQGKYIGEHHGFTAHPENSGRNKRSDGILHGMTLDDLKASVEED